MKVRDPVPTSLGLASGVLRLSVGWNLLPSVLGPLVLVMRPLSFLLS